MPEKDDAIEEGDFFMSIAPNHFLEEADYSSAAQTLKHRQILTTMPLLVTQANETLDIDNA